MIPGINLLGLAASVIQMQSVGLLRFKARFQNDRGQHINEYYPVETIQGSWQPASESTIRNLGLDASQRYFNLYTARDISGVQRGAAPDLLVLGGKRYDVIGVTDWHALDGWKGILCVEAGPYDPERA
ncbi:phage collar protein [Bordetella avium]|uniref:Phage protein n=2 Tax=Bordetella avium TaxID=521 RepID=Q2L2V9_BORA1|nr:hypothetical protein [Bordetella avium]CAJ48930.1 putative phage protein [Bordetella avium 197N]